MNEGKIIGEKEADKGASQGGKKRKKEVIGGRDQEVWQGGEGR